MAIWGQAQSIENFELPDMHIPSWVEQGNADFFFPLSYYKQVSFSFIAKLFAFLWGLLLIFSLFEVAPAA